MAGINSLRYKDLRVGEIMKFNNMEMKLDTR